MESPQKDDSLSRILGDWRVAPPRNPSFRAGVWSRLEAARAALPWPAYLRLHAAALTSALALALVLGAWVGREQAQARVATDRDTIARQYVQALDARAMVP